MEAQWWERSPPTIVARVRLLVPVSYVGWVCCWFSSLLREVFLRVLRFSPLLKNQHFHIPIRSGAHGHVLTIFRARKCFVGKQITLTFFLGTFTIVLIGNLRRWRKQRHVSYIADSIPSFLLTQKTFSELEKESKVNSTDNVLNIGLNSLHSPSSTNKQGW